MINTYKLKPGTYSIPSSLDQLIDGNQHLFSSEKSYLGQVGEIHVSEVGPKSRTVSLMN